MKAPGILAYCVARPSWWPPPAAGDFLFALPADRAQARPDAYAEAKSGSQGSDRPTAGAPTSFGPRAQLRAQAPFARYSTL